MFLRCEGCLVSRHSPLLAKSLVNTSHSRLVAPSSPSSSLQVFAGRIFLYRSSLLFLVTRMTMKTTRADSTRSAAGEGVSKGATNALSKANADDTALLATSWRPLLHEPQEIMVSSPKVTGKNVVFLGGTFYCLCQYFCHSSRFWCRQFHNIYVELFCAEP